MTGIDFLHSILEQPDDDVLRLAYADFLQERGGEESAARGEFIQVLAQRAGQNPGAASANLRDALASGGLPEVVRERFAEVCARRRLWRDHVANKRFGPAPTPAQRNWRTDKQSVWLAASQLLHNAGRHAARHEGGKISKPVIESGVRKEAAWLLARLTELLQSAVPAPEATPEPAAAKKIASRRRK